VILYRYIRNLRHTLAISLGFGFILVGGTISVMMLMDDYNDKTTYETLFGIPSYYYMLAGFVLAFLFFFKRKKTKYYLITGLGFIIAIVMSILEFFNTCTCDYIIEGDISICHWAVILFGGALILKKLVFGWSMQFIVIEWQVYALTKDPLSLGIIGLCEFIPAFFLAPFAGHIVDKKEKRNLFTFCIALFSLISFGLFWLTSTQVESSWEKNTILFGIYGLVFFGGVLRAFFGPTIFSLIALLVPKIGVHYTLGIIFLLVMLAFLLVFQIDQKPILNKESTESVKESLKAGLSFVFNDKVVLGALTLDMIAVLPC